ncbi:hypothetical protein AMECASPLE_014212 [Ameca splendens]|uniref:Uncharacterized protein n=1 Tax=Ameca splendens TaxID=208324 RepID=A0ABV0XES6_9TELE
MTKFEESSVNKGLATANLPSWVGVARSVGPTKTARYHGDALSIVLLPDRETAPLGVVETESPQGILCKQSAFCRSQRKKSSNSCTLITAFMNEYRVHKQQFIRT